MAATTSATVPILRCRVRACDEAKHEGRNSGQEGEPTEYEGNCEERAEHGEANRDVSERTNVRFRQTRRVALNSFDWHAGG